MAMRRRDTTKIVNYRTTDGLTFDSHAAADLHQRQLDFTQWILSPSGTPLKEFLGSPEVLFIWLMDNQETVLTALGQTPIKR